ncbi:hypothetical protein BT96DRAFT_1005846 [Gymnopus androsaceus JB14]|uniref:Uncharacterized protein n=1 Tax=Gymnopus androsaceus JB14 TaxID=1447944 RepID=A0A6A4GN28_9AGAR|nr:hypothetical protein BT96DRAFT_1005846 [Gymnopus androsaceus JB14]
MEQGPGIRLALPPPPTRTSAASGSKSNLHGAEANTNSDLDSITAMANVDANASSGLNTRNDSGEANIVKEGPYRCTIRSRARAGRGSKSQSFGASNIGVVEGESAAEANADVDARSATTVETGPNTMMTTRSRTRSSRNSAQIPTGLPTPTPTGIISTSTDVNVDQKDNVSKPRPSSENQDDAGAGTGRGRYSAEAKRKGKAKEPEQRQSRERERDRNQSKSRTQSIIGLMAAVANETTASSSSSVLAEARVNAIADMLARAFEGRALEVAERRKGKGKTGADTDASEKKDDAIEYKRWGKDDVEERLGSGSESKVQAQDDGKRGRTLYPSLNFTFGVRGQEESPSHIFSERGEDFGGCAGGSKSSSSNETERERGRAGGEWEEIGRTKALGMEKLLFIASRNLPGNGVYHSFPFKLPIATFLSQFHILPLSTSSGLLAIHSFSLSSSVLMLFAGEFELLESA